MSGQKKQPQKKRTRPKGEGRKLRKALPVILGTLLIYTFCIMLCAVVILCSDTSGAAGYCAVPALCAAAFLSAYISAMRAKQNGLLTGFLTTLPIHIVLLLASLLYGGFSADLTLMFTFAVLTIVSMLGGVLAVNRREKPHKLHHRKPGRTG